MERFKSKQHKCKYCRKVFSRASDLRRHEHTRKNIECSHCDRRYCNISDLQKHLRTITAITHNFDLDNPISPVTGYELNPGYKHIVKQNWRKIKDKVRNFKYHKVINIHLKPGFTYKNLYQILDRIYCNQSVPYKTNIGFGFILKNFVSGEFKYYYNSINNLLFEHAITISNRKHLQTFFQKIINLDLQTNYYLKKPNSSYVFCGLTNLEIFVYHIQNTLIGSYINLPEYIRKCKSLMTLTHHYSPKYIYKDNLCFFRCISLFQGFNSSGLERNTKKLLLQAESYFKKSFKKGVLLSDIPNMEILFRVSVNIYSLKENGSADVIYLSRLLFKPIYLNLYKNHFSYIKRFATFAKKFECKLCDRIFNQTNNLKRHLKTCKTEIKEIFSGGKLYSRKTLFERLEEVEIIIKDRYYKYVSCFDYEALQLPIEDTINGRTISSKHVPASFSVCSNIPKHTTPIHKVSKGSPQQLVDKMIQILLQQQEAVSVLMRKKYKVTIDKLEGMVSMYANNPEAGNKRFRSLLSALYTYCDQLIVIGFNSQRYDIPLIRKYLPASLRRFDSLPYKIIKKGNSYMCLSTKRLKFLDLTNYLAPGTSLSALYKSYNVKTPKGHFPYEYFNSLDKLKDTKLPPRKEFFSTLTNKTIDKKIYNECLEIWNSKSMKTFADYLEFYNNADVHGLVEVVEKMLKIERSNGLDLFKDSISLPGITQQYLFKNLKKDYFVGIGREHNYIYNDLRQFAIIGGPAIVFHRMHIAGETRIKNKHLCKKIIGYDANSLYLWCIAQDMPTGFYSLREKSNNFKKSMRYSKQAIQWLDHLNKERGVFITHSENSIHGEVRIENYLVDGFEEDTSTIFEFYGCYYHGHDCNPKYNHSKWKKTLKREEDLRSLGYNVVSITSCEWEQYEASKIWYSFKELECTFKDILQAITDNKIFGIVKCSLHVPLHLIDTYSEFPPIFKNVEIKLEDIGDHMLEHCRKINRKVGVKKSLISSMWAKNLIILTPLLKKYVEMGLVVDDIEFVMEYNPKRCFKWFQDEVVNDRRMADLNSDWKIRGETSKCKGKYILHFCA